MNLLQSLTSELNISEEQAKGGVGLILNTIRGEIDEADYAEIQSAIPNAEEMIDSAPNTSAGNTGSTGMLGGLGGVFGATNNSDGATGGGLGGLLDSVGGALGEAAEGAGLGGILSNLGGLSGLVNGFSELNMNSDTLQRFLPIVMQFINGGNDSESKVTDVLGRVFG